MAKRAVPTEVEAKLLIPDDRVLRALARLRHIGRYSLESRGTVRLQSTYVDTPGLTLVRHGVALRLRSAEGKWEMTAKWDGSVDGVVHSRAELTVPLPDTPTPPFTLPPGPLRDRLNALVAGRPLQPILVTEVTRRLFDVLRPKAPHQPLAELALDRVRLRAAPGQGQAAAAYLEMEIELRQGSSRDLAAITRFVRSRYALMPSTQSKFGRGMALVHGPGIAAAREPDTLHAADDPGTAVRKVLGRQLERMRAHDPGTRAGDVDALHDMRVATRRARAAVRAFGDGLPADLRTHLAGELRWLGGLLGKVRDLDVQMANLDRYLAEVPADHAAALQKFHGHLSAEREQHRQELLRELDALRYFDLLTQLEALTGQAQAAPPASPSREHIGALGRRAIRRAYRRLVKRGSSIQANPTAEDLHALRIRSKRLRYLLEFLRDLIGEPGKRVIRQLVRLQDILGAHQDAVVAADVVRQYVRQAARAAAPAALLALDALVGFQLRTADRTRDDLKQGWERFTSARAAADFDALLAALDDRAPSAP